MELLIEAERALSMGRVERAEQLYRQVVTADPRNAIAVVGLARVALEQADDREALVLARRALAIDAENDAARRLTERLEEVLRTRGEALPEVQPVAAAVEPPPAEVAAADKAVDDVEAEGPGATEDAGQGSESAPRRSLLDRLRRRRRAE